MSSEERRRDPGAPLRIGDLPLRIGVSSCLLGERVRWDGGHKRDAFLAGELAPFVEWVPVCPELELGMGVPREPIRLVGRAGGARARAPGGARAAGAHPRLVGERNGRDWSGPMRAWARPRVRALAALGLCGYVLKQGSPSCGLERVAVWSAAGRAARRGRGLFAEALLEGLPLLPVEEERRLADPCVRDHWLERIFAQRRLRAFFAGRWSRAGLAAFHGAHELQLLAHSPRHLAELARLAAGDPALGRAALRARYEAGFAAALRVPATPRRHARALRHAAERLRSGLDPREQRALAARIADHGRGELPLRAPLACVRAHAARLGIEALGGQLYLAPSAAERTLRKLG